MTRIAHGIFGLSLLAASASPASAELILYEPFDYTFGGALTGQAGGTWDPTRAWQVGGPSNGSANDALITSGLTLSDYPVAGNAAEVVQNHNGSPTYQSFAAGRQLPTTLNVPSGSDVWFSFLFNQDQEGSFANESQVNFGEEIGTGTRKMISRFVTLFGDNNPDNAAVGADNSVGTSSGAVIQQDTTYLAVSRFTNINGPTFSSNEATMWILEASDWDAIKGGPIDTTSLDNNSLLKVNHTPGNTFSVGLTTADYLQLNVTTGFGINNRASFDELRLGTTLDSVLIPEPASAALAGLGLFLLASRRRGS
ncbi:MAG: hypothetical protein AAGH92_07650 [Planctomycetota bacterium]